MNTLDNLDKINKKREVEPRSGGSDQFHDPI